MTFTGHTGQVNRVAFSRDGLRLFSCSHDDTLRVWDTSTGRELLSPLTGHSGEVCALALGPQGLLAASGAQNGTIILWPAAPWREDQQPVILPPTAPSNALQTDKPRPTATRGAGTGS